MKKLLTLFTLLLTVCSGAWGDTTFKCKLNGSVVQERNDGNSGDFFSLTFSSGGAGWKSGTDVNGCTYDGVNYTSALKFDSKPTLSFTTTQSATIIAVIDTKKNSGASCYLDGSNMASSEDIAGAKVWTSTNVSAGSHTIKKGGSEIYIYCVYVIYPELKPGAISFNPAAGSIETGSNITLSSSGANTILYKWGESAIDGNGDWSGATTYDNEHKPVVPSVGSSNNVLSVKSTNTYGSTYGSATYTITAAKTVTTTTINTSGITNLDVNSGTSAGTLTASVTAGGSPVDGATVTWASSDESIVKVGETTGEVTLVAAGDANITATYAGDETHAASFDVYAIEVKDTRKHVTLSFSTTSITDYNFDGETLTAPILTAKDEGDNTIDLAELTGLTFAESHEDKVTPTVSVNATTGAITAANTNNFGTSTVTVSFPGNSNYKSAVSKSYTVTRAPMLYQVKFDNGFEGFIEEGTKKVNVFYMAGTSAPAQTGTIKKAEGYSATVVGNTVVLTKDTHTKTYTIVPTAKTPFEGTGKQTFDGTESYVASGYGWDDTKKWKFSKTDNDWTREAPGKTRLYFFVGAATNLQLSESGLSDRNINVYVNGVKDETITSIEKNKSITITLNPNQVNMVEIQSNQTGGDGGFKDMTLTSPKKAVKIGSHGWTSLISDKNLNFEGIDGLNAYAAKLNETTVTLNDVTEVPANKGIVLRGTENETYYVPVLASTDADVDTDLTGNATAAYNKDGEKYYYVLANKGGVEGFYEYTGTAAIPAGKAFFETSSKIAAGKFSIVFADDETDGIKAVSTKVENGVRYNLAGQKVGADYKGIVIVNGKKYLNK